MNIESHDNKNMADEICHGKHAYFIQYVLLYKKKCQKPKKLHKPCIYITYFAAQRSNLPATVQWILEAFNENTQDCDLSATHKHGWVNRSLRK